MHISRRMHGALDYVVGVFLILAPKLFGLEYDGPEGRVLVILGVVAIVYSLLTRYELGVLKVLPFRVHLTLDALHAIVLAVSPWLFRFADRVWVPHVILGGFELLVVVMTRRSGVTAHPGAPAHP